jgi:hypothetical protein
MEKQEMTRLWINIDTSPPSPHGGAPEILHQEARNLGAALASSHQDLPRRQLKVQRPISFGIPSQKMEKTIIVTGASRGIGLAVAKSLLEASHNVVLISRSAEPLQELKERYPSKVACLAADMTAEDVSDAEDLVSPSITTQNVCVLTFSRQH